ncbi:MAG: hypothetical protein SFU86_04130 [Pirellulaceae bacterium]|nr:hypothetical protein [Pirellulaceae bacterium]
MLRSSSPGVCELGGACCSSLTSAMTSRRASLRGCLGEGIHGEANSVTTFLTGTIAQSSRWQISLRSLLVLTAMTALVLAWWREFGERFADLVTSRWITVATIVLPFVAAGWELRLRRFLPEVLKLCVVLAALNTVWSFEKSLAAPIGCSLQSKDWIGEVRVGLWASLIWSFLLPAALALVASLLAFNQKSSHFVRHFAIISIIAVNLLLIYYGVTLFMETTMVGFGQWRSSLYDFLLRFDSHP